MKRLIILIGIIIALIALNSCAASMGGNEIYKSGKKSPLKQKSGVMTTSWNK